MKKWVFLFLLCIGLIYFYIEPVFAPKVDIQHGVKDEEGNFENVHLIEVTVDQIYQGNLLLVNQEYPVRKTSIKSDIVHLHSHPELTKEYGLTNDIQLSQEIGREFSKMIAAANKEGVRNFTITSGFRGFEEQGMLYKQMGSDYALPAGYSEHNLGLSLDVGSTQMKMADAPEGKWVEENAWKFGFILRYPKDKTEVTGIQYEPWHIRYVGLPHSAIMNEKNMVLEEYLDYLREEKVISVSMQGENYTIIYYPITEDTKLEVPRNTHYEISGNNMDGVIVTVYE